MTSCQVVQWFTYREGIGYRKWRRDLLLQGCISSKNIQSFSEESLFVLIGLFNLLYRVWILQIHQ